MPIDKATFDEIMATVPPEKQAQAIAIADRQSREQVFNPDTLPDPMGQTIAPPQAIDPNIQKSLTHGLNFERSMGDGSIPGDSIRKLIYGEDYPQRAAAAREAFDQKRQAAIDADPKIIAMREREKEEAEMSAVDKEAAAARVLTPGLDQKVALPTEAGGVEFMSDGQPQAQPGQPGQPQAAGYGRSMSRGYRGGGGGSSGQMGSMIKEHSALREKLEAIEEQHGRNSQEYANALIDIKKEQGGIARDQAGQESVLAYERQAQVEKQNADRAALLQRQENEYNEAQDSLFDAIQEIKSGKVDTDRLFKDASGNTNYGRKVVAAIAVGLGAFAQSLSPRYGGSGGKGPNTALQIVQSAINRDIAAQKADMANKRAGVGMQKSLMGQMMKRFGNEKQAEAASRIAMLEDYKTKLSAVAAKSKSDMMPSKLEESFNAIEQASAKEQVNFQKETVAKTQQSLAQGFGMVRDKRAGDQRAQQMRQQREALMMKASGTSGGRQLPASAVQKMADFKGAAKMIKDLRDSWDRDVGAFSIMTQWVPGSSAKKFGTKASMAAQFIGKKLEGRMTDEDFKRIKSFMPEPGDLDSTAKRKLEDMMSMLEQQEAGALETYANTGFDVSGFVKPQDQIPAAAQELKGRQD